MAYQNMILYGPSRLFSLLAWLYSLPVTVVWRFSQTYMMERSVVPVGEIWRDGQLWRGRQ